MASQCDAFQFVQCLYLITNVYVGAAEAKTIFRFICTQRIGSRCRALVHLFYFRWILTHEGNRRINYVRIIWTLSFE